MLVEVQSTKTSPANLHSASMQEVPKAFRFKYGMTIPSGLFGFATYY